MGEATMTTPAAAAATGPTARGHAFAKLVAVVRREFMERVRTRWFLISTLLGPLFFGALMIGPAWLAMRESGSATATNVTIVDATGAGLGERVARALVDSAAPATAPRPQVVTVAAADTGAAVGAARAEVTAERRVGVLVLDSATLAGSRARYMGRNASSLADVERLRDVVRRQSLALRLSREGLPAERVEALTLPRLRLATERVSSDGRAEGSGAGGMMAAVFVAFLLYMMILLYGQNVLRSVLEEKTTRVAELVMASVRPDILMAGKVIGVGAVGLVQQVIWIGAGAALSFYVMPFLKLAAPGGATRAAAAQAAQAADATASFAMPVLGIGTIASAVLFYVLGYLIYSALFAAIGAMVNTEQEAQQAAFPVMLPIIFGALLMQIMLRNPESALARFGAWFPLTAPILMPMRMALVSVSAAELALVVLGLAASALGILWVSARIYRVGMLMYGKRPSIAELSRWVRQAA